MKNTTLLTTLFSTLLTLSLISLFGFSNKNISNTDYSNTHLPKNYGIGSIIIWPGNDNQIPKGWMICNGTKLSKKEYGELYKKIGPYWGVDKGDSQDFFKLPDLRGVFIRGVNGNRNDMYSATQENRFNLMKKPSKDVGSFQLSQNQSHTHGFTKGNVSGGHSNPSVLGSGYGGLTEGYLNNVAIKNSGGFESRPINAYVHFIIYVGN